MIKQLRIIIITAVAIVVLFAGVLFVSFSPVFHKITPSSSAATSSDISLIKTDANNITKIKITNSSGSYTIVKTASNIWNIDQIDSSLVITSAVSSVVTSASQLTASMVIATDPPDLSVYGLDKPLATVELTINNQIRTLLIGKVSPLGNSYYLMEKGNNTVYLTSSASNFFISKMSFINASLLTVDQTNDVPNISAYTFGGSARTAPIDIVKESTTSSSSIGSGYTITEPLTLDTGSDQLSTLNKSLASLTANDCVDLNVSNANLKKYGLDNPKYTFSVTFSNKTTTLLFGDTVTDSGSNYIYIMLSGRNAIFRILTSNVPFYNYKLIDLASPLQFIYMINDVKSITVQSGSKTWQFDLSGADDTLAIKYGNKTLTKQYFQDYYQTLVGIQIEGETSLPKNPRLLCKITFSFKDTTKADRVSEFYFMNGSFSAWSINGKTNFYTLTSSLNKLIANTLKIANNQDVSTN